MTSFEVLWLMCLVFMFAVIVVGLLQLARRGDASPNTTRSSISSSVPAVNTTPAWKVKEAQRKKRNRKSKAKRGTVLDATVAEEVVVVTEATPNAADTAEVSASAPQILSVETEVEGEGVHPSEPTEVKTAIMTEEETATETETETEAPTPSNLTQSNESLDVVALMDKLFIDREEDEEICTIPSPTPSLLHPAASHLSALTDAAYTTGTSLGADSESDSESHATYLSSNAFLRDLVSDDDSVHSGGTHLSALSHDAWGKQQSSPNNTNTITTPCYEGWHPLISGTAIDDVRALFDHPLPIHTIPTPTRLPTPSETKVTPSTPKEPTKTIRKRGKRGGGGGGNVKTAKTAKVASVPTGGYTTVQGGGVGVPCGGGGGGGMAYTHPIGLTIDQINRYNHHLAMSLKLREQARVLHNMSLYGGVYNYAVPKQPLQPI